jgi:hypothetical protein
MNGSDGLVLENAGFDADLVVLKSDPAANITALSHVAYPIRNGKILFDSRASTVQNTSQQLR